jgi:hypothetical protein
LSAEWLLPVHVAATWFMVGLIWFVQIVHYPLFAGVGSTPFMRYAQQHQRRTTLVVLPPMLIELGTAIQLVLVPSTDVPRAAAIAGLALLALIWASTFLLQVPCHRRLSRGFEAAAHRTLVWTNLLRALLWSARGVLVLSYVWG